jgi:hypothetical protein
MMNTNALKSHYKKVLFFGGLITLAPYVAHLPKWLSKKFGKPNHFSGSDLTLAFIQNQTKGGDHTYFQVISSSRQNPFNIYIRKEPKYRSSSKTGVLEPQVADNLTMIIKADVLARNLISLAQDQQSPNSSPDVPTPLESFGIQLSALRRRKKVSVDNLAEFTGIPKSELLKIEVGLASLAQVEESLPLLAEALEISAEQLSRLLATAIVESLEEEIEA